MNVRALLAACLLSWAGVSGSTAAIAAEPGAESDAEEAVDAGRDGRFEALRRKAEREGEWALGKEEQVAVSQDVLTRPWNRMPFDPRPFDYTPEQIRAQWGTLMRGFGMPYVSAGMLRRLYERYPAMRRDHPGFDGDFERLEAELNEVWRLFLRGDYQLAMQRGQSQGQMGVMAGKIAQIYYALYAEPELPAKHMLLQDAANTIRRFGVTFEQMKQSEDPADRNNYVLARLSYIYAIGRIAEDVPIPVAITRNYAFKVLGAVHDVRALAPDNPLGMAAGAGIDANVVRKVGKAVGRITFGARQSAIRSGFERALQGSDIALIRYEYANAILYVNKRRDVDEAIAQLQRAAAIRPRFAMEALDAMYAAKRLHEVRAFAASGKSFRAFERERTQYQRERNENLYCVLPGRCPPFLLAGESTSLAGR